ncbi:MAG: ABC transporter ATP-binding protein [Actinobacteria bacterium]|nr:ABC transporter ATP-binding protein [Actinomycetota bacterium]
MLRLARYLKPYIPLIVIAFVLLFVQAMADLALPNYMSNIVNNGIQQGGIDSSVPEAIRKGTMDKITLFMSGDERGQVLGKYILVDETSTGFEERLKDYPLLEKEAVYILKDTGRNEIESMNSIIGKAFLAVSGVEKMAENLSGADAAVMLEGFDLPELPGDMTDEKLFEILSTLPEEKLSMIRGTISAQFENMDESMIIQSSAGLVRAEYDALGMDTGKIQGRYILRTGLLMLLISLLAAACTVIVGYLSSKTAAGLSRDLRKKLFDRVQDFSNIEFDKFSTASLITRSTNDITQIQMLVIILIRMVSYAPIMGIGGIIRALEKSASMSWMIAVAVIVVICLVITVFSVTLPRFKKMQNLIDRLNLVMRENLSGIMVIRAFNNQEFEENRFDRANSDLTGTSLFINRVMVTMFPVMMLLMNGFSLLIIWTGSHQVAQSGMRVGDMMAFMQYAILVITSFLMLSIMFIMIPRASVSAGRVAEVLETEPVIHDPGHPKRFGNKTRGLVEFRNVSFRYPGAEEDVLHDIDFTAKPGLTTAIIGSTGSGKSTIAGLLLRFYDISMGRILVDGMDIREVSRYDLRSRIGYVPQKSFLFSGTIGSNLSYADENAGEGILRKASEVAQALDFIDAKTEKFDAEISQGGRNVSGGQSQRLSIARALVKNPEILILDDCFSALDFRTDRALRKAIKDQYGDRTIIVIAQRVGTVMNAEQIIAIDDGRIAGMGNHSELMKSCDVYREIALSQLSREELA